MTVEFVDFTDFFEINRYKQDEELQEFDRYNFSDLHPQIKGFIFVTFLFFCYKCFIENSHQSFFALLFAL